MGPAEREVVKALTQEGTPHEVQMFLEVFGYFPGPPGVRLATEEELALLADYEPPEPEPSAEPYVSEHFKAPTGRRGSGGARTASATGGSSATTASATKPEAASAPESRKSASGAVAPEGSAAVARENVDEKGRRLLTEGRLQVARVDPDARLIVAKCRGDSGEIYDLGFDPRSNEWRCTCEARGNCAHLVALKLVTVKS